MRQRGGTRWFARWVGLVLCGLLSAAWGASLLRHVGVGWNDLFGVALLIGWIGGSLTGWLPGWTVAADYQRIFYEDVRLRPGFLSRPALRRGEKSQMG